MGGWGAAVARWKQGGPNKKKCRELWIGKRDTRRGKTNLEGRRCCSPPVGLTVYRSAGLLRRPVAQGVLDLLPQATRADHFVGPNLLLARRVVAPARGQATQPRGVYYNPEVGVFPHKPLWTCGGAAVTRASRGRAVAVALQRAYMREAVNLEAKANIMP